MRDRRKIVKDYDVIVVGGGLSGVCAALASARNGARTAIIQSRPVFGGNASSEVRMHICGASCHVRKPDLGEAGILQELLLENKSRNHNFSFPLWDVVIWSKIKSQKNLDFYLNTVMDEVVMKENSITSIICRQASTEVIYEFRGKVFVDATGNASLGYYSGAEYRSGSESKYEFDEPDAPEEANAYTMGNTIMFTSKDLGEAVPFKKPEWAYSFTEEDLRGRAHGNTTVCRGENGIVEEYNVDSGYWWIELGGDSGKIIEETENLNEELYKCLFGIWDHIKNKGDHGAENYELDWVGSVPGIRESRRLVGDYILTENDILSNRLFEDAVAYGGWPMDMHSPRGLYDPDTPTTHINYPGAYTIPYRCYYSKNIDNLMMAGRDISTTKMAFGSTRVMGTCAIGGQAVGTAAAIATKYNCSPKEIGQNHIKELQQTLLKDDCHIPGIKNNDNLDLALTSKISASSYIDGNEPEKIITGVTRNVGEESNCWESKGISEEGEKISLQLPNAQKISQVRVVFDPNLNQEIMISMTKRVQQKEVKYMPLELVRDYAVKIYNDNALVFEKKIQENVERLAVVDIPETDGVVGDKVVLEICSTYGYENARVFEIRIY